mmetsp:Transcript_66408/g.98420  ORF Transcript_66408/g.98420 Transcript_66408/m.98420 type:complete len:121 (-) Transcript_66408:103-465(-)
MDFVIDGCMEFFPVGCIDCAIVGPMDEFTRCCIDGTSVGSTDVIVDGGVGVSSKGGNVNTAGCTNGDSVGSINGDNVKNGAGVCCNDGIGTAFRVFFLRKKIRSCKNERHQSHNDYNTNN